MIFEWETAVIIIIMFFFIRVASEALSISSDLDRASFDFSINPVTFMTSSFSVSYDTVHVYARNIDPRVEKACTLFLSGWSRCACFRETAHR